MTETKPIAFFDVDKTLCEGYSGYYVTRDLIRRGILKKRRILKAVLYKSIGSLLRQMNVRHMYEIILKDLAGLRLDDVMEIGLEIFEQKVKPRVYTEAIKEVERLKKAGYQVVLISSGPSMSIRCFEDFFQADHSFSVGPVVEEGILQSRLQEPLCYEEGKVILAKQYAESQNLNLRDCTFYSDSISDLPLLLEVAHPRVVNPDKFLLEEAKKREWPILTFQETLGGELR